MADEDRAGYGVGSGNNTFDIACHICSELLHSLLIQSSLLCSHGDHLLVLLLSSKLAGNLRLEAAQHKRTEQCLHAFCQPLYRLSFLQKCQ